MLGRSVTPLLLLALCACGRSLPSPPDAEPFQVRTRDGGPDERDGDVTPASCGNRRLDPGEQCDGGELDGQTCRQLGFAGGSLACRACELDTSDCRRSQLPPGQCEALPESTLPQRCLRQVCECDPDAFVQCDAACLSLIECAAARCPDNTRDVNCIIQSCGEYLAGAPTATQLTECFDAARPLCVAAPEDCGNGEIDGFEQCDGAQLDGATCRNQGFGSGSLHCSASCRFDFSDCENDARCGDGAVDPGEECDGDALAGRTCGDFGFTQGELACADDCRFDASTCHTCGDGRIQAHERCDGDNLGGLTCQRFGFTGGTLACNEACAYDTNGCAVCGNGVIEAGENCDSMALAGHGCESLGQGTGVLACEPNACVFDISGCSTASPQTCGNGIAERGEQCDGADLTRLSCADLGYDEGQLACNAATCRFDTSGCEHTGSPGPGQDCSECSAEACGDITAACEADPTCFAGLDCLAEECGATGDLGCAMRCFRNLQSAITAVSLFGCVTSQCGPSCVGL